MRLWNSPRPRRTPPSNSAPEPESPVKLRGPVAALFLAPLPPRRPNDLSFQIAGLGAFPMPPARPSDLSGPLAPIVAPAIPPARPATLASALYAPDTTASFAPADTRPIQPATFVQAGSGGSGFKSVPVSYGSDLVADVLHNRLPKVITRGLSSRPRMALALAEPPPSPTAVSAEDGALLARAAELTAPLPPMPIPGADALTAQTVAPQPSQKAASLSSLERVKRLFSGLFGSSSQSSAQ